MIDTHTHIYDQAFADDREAMIHRALEQGITQMILPNVDLESIEPMHKLCEQYPTLCLATMGLHPTSVEENYKEVLEEMEQRLTQYNYCAIGEIGIDLYWDKTKLEWQQNTFAQQLEWADQYNLPVIIHTRESYDETIAILKERKGETRGVFHSFVGTPQQAEEVMTLGDFYFGINGIATFKNSNQTETIKTIGMDRIVLETDAPYLTPVPFRGKRNEPAYLSYIVARLSEIFNLSNEEVKSLTTQNVRKIFQKQSFKS